MIRDRSGLKEVLLIVVGVLLAFAIESRWSDYQEAREDRGYLIALRAELVANRVHLGERREHLQRVREAVNTLTDAEQAAEVSPAQIPALLWQATSVFTPITASTALESLGTSATWSRLEDDTLQAALSAMAVELERIAVMGRQAEDYWFEVLEPAISERIDYDEWARLGYENQAPGPDFDAAQWSALREERSVRNRLIHALWFARSLDSRAIQLIDRINEVIDLLPGD